MDEKTLVIDGRTRSFKLTPRAKATAEKELGCDLRTAVVERGGTYVTAVIASACSTHGRSPYSPNRLLTWFEREPRVELEVEKLVTTMVLDYYRASGQISDNEDDPVAGDSVPPGEDEAPSASGSPSTDSPAE